LPAMVMAIMVAAALIVRVDIDLGITALAATLLNAGFLLVVILAQTLPALMISTPRRSTASRTSRNDWRHWRLNSRCAPDQVVRMLSGLKGEMPGPEHFNFYQIPIQPQPH